MCIFYKHNFYNHIQVKVKKARVEHVLIIVISLGSSKEEKVFWKWENSSYLIFNVSDKCICSDIFNNILFYCF